jgi:DNA processing protein
VNGRTHLTGLSTGERAAACLVALSYLPGLGPATLRRCHLEHGAEESWSDLVAGRPDRIVPILDLAARGRPELPARLVAEARRRNPAVDLAAQRHPGRRIHVHGAPGYPDRLVADPAAPAVLFSEGDLRALDAPSVAVVGTRNATLAGRRLAEELGEGLAGAGVAVVSGLALGIDGAAHRGALGATGARSVGVIASGLDVVYPRRHVDLHVDLARRGLLVSETPAGIRPDAWRFPARNRIIAGLADAVVVVESRIAGGSLHTVDEALVRDVPVLAVPGHPSAPAAAGTNALLYDGAGLVRDVADVLLAIGVTPPHAPRCAPSAGVAPDLGPAERAVLDALGSTPSSLAEVVAATGRTVGEVAHALAGLATSGRVREHEGWYEVAGSTVARR